jgi:hypothetical protein
MTEQWTDEQLDWFKAEWEKHVHGPVRLLTPLPRRVRFRLAVQSRIDAVAIWLAEHKHYKAARAVWKLGR